MKIFTIAAAIWTAIGLALSAYIHLTLAGSFDANAGTLVSQGWLFRIQAGVDIVAALLVLSRRRWAGLLAGAVALGGLGLVVLTVYLPLDLTIIGFPYLYEPLWYQDKVIVALAQAIAVIGGLVVAVRARRQPSAVHDAR